MRARAAPHRVACPPHTVRRIATPARPNQGVGSWAHASPRTLQSVKPSECVWGLRWELAGLSNGSKYFQYPVLKVLAKYCRSDFAVEVLWVRIFCELAVAACTASALRLSDMFVYSETFVDGVQHWRTRITSQFTHSEGLLREIRDFSDSVELNSKESVGFQPTKVWKERDVEAVD